MRINCLEPQIYNKIAAGEVVERPASIVKELVENSVDAGANLITVSIVNGGIQEIKVEDNGKGIHFDDLERAFLPHATSKISSIDDLFSIKTLGFRGEALASIASVSEVELESKQKDAECGGKIEISGGNVLYPATISGCANGTSIKVSNLFFNVPARHKFLKKPKTEEGEITTLMAKFILANPCVSFKYIIDGKIKYISSGKGMQDALFVVYGKDSVENSVYIEKDFGYIKIYGFVGKPSFSKANRTYQTIIINNRVVQNQIISASIQNAYGDMLMKKQFPFFVLYIDLDYTQVDVNVHPNKHEVRFENGKDIYEKVFSVVNRKLNAIDYTTNVSSSLLIEKPTASVDLMPQKSFSLPISTETVIIESNNIEEPLTEHILNNLKENQFETGNMGAAMAPAEIKTTNISVEYKTINNDLAKRDSVSDNTRSNIFSAMHIINESEDESLGAGVSLGSKLLSELQSKISNMEQQELQPIQKSIKVIGVIFKTYIICEYEESMLLIDQHAGHERLLFDKFINGIKNQKVDVQPLFVPYILSLNSAEESIFEYMIPMLNNIGFEVEEFGLGSYRVNSVPYLLSEINLEKFFNGLLSEGKQYKTITITELLKEKIASMACKAAVKAGDSLSENEIIILLNEFKKNGTQLLCPHGRPVVVKLEKKDLEKWFKRIV